MGGDAERYGLDWFSPGVTPYNPQISAGIQADIFISEIRTTVFIKYVHK